MRHFPAVLLLLALAAWAPPLQALQIVIQPGAGLASNSDALGAFQRAATQWESLFDDDVRVEIDADLAVGLPVGVVGNTSSVRVQRPFDEVRAALMADADADDGVLQSLPAFADFSARLPDGFALGGDIEGTKANFKALGMTQLDAMLGASDGSIVLNASFAFDFDNRDGVVGSQFDFETVAAHEIGHLLGFLSAVDSVDSRLALGAAGLVAPTPLDLFRFAREDAPVDELDFLTATRSLAPGSDALLADLGALGELLSTGVFAGDGREASHWRDDRLTRRQIGLMDPTLRFGRVAEISPADLRAYDLIGWNAVVVPEPASVGLVLIGLVGLGARRGGTRRRCPR